MTREVGRDGLALSTGEIMRELAGIQETVVLYPSTGGRLRARRVLTEMSSTQERLFEIFNLGTFAPRSLVIQPATKISIVDQRKRRWSSLEYSRNSR